METKMIYTQEALEYIAKIAEGGMRDAITLLDKCLSFSPDLTLENVIKALGTVDYDVMKNLTNAMLTSNTMGAIKIVEEVHSQGKDIKQFLSQYVQFLLDVQKYALTKSFEFIKIPGTAENKEWLNDIEDYGSCFEILRSLIRLNSNIKWSQTAKYDLEAELMLLIAEANEE